MRSTSDVRRVMQALVVEDDEVLRRTIADVLGEVGYQTCECETLDEARHAISVTDPLVVILDLSLQRDFGADLLDELAARENAPAVVVCSAFPLAQLVAARHGVPCVPKPFDVDHLLAVVERAARERARPRRTA